MISNCYAGYKTPTYSAVITTPGRDILHTQLKAHLLASSFSYSFFTIVIAPYAVKLSNAWRYFTKTNSKHPKYRI